MVRPTGLSVAGFFMATLCVGILAAKPAETAESPLQTPAGEAVQPTAPEIGPGDSPPADAERAATNPLGKRLPTPANFKLVGGWRVPAAVRQPDHKSLAWGNGGLAVRDDGTRLTFYTTHHNHLGGPIQELMVGTGPGVAAEPVSSWPVLGVGEFLGDLYRPAREAHPDTAQPDCTGVFLDGDRLITTGRAAYAAPPPEGPFLCAAGKAYGVQAGTAQLLGGGLCDIPA